MNKDKSYTSMTDSELTSELSDWESRVAGASGFASAHFAAKQVEIIVRIGNSRGLRMVNNFPIVIG